MSELDSIQIPPAHSVGAVEGIPCSPETAFTADPTQSAGFKAERPADVPDAYIYSQNMKAAGGAESGSKRHFEKRRYPASSAQYSEIGTPT